MLSQELPYLKSEVRLGCLLIHGFTSTPAELHPIKTGLEKEGYTTQSILLAGHGTKPEDLLEMRYKEWIESAQQGVNELKKQGKQIVVIGHSLGGLLALQMAARNSIFAVITIAAALKPSDRKIHFAWLLKHFRTYVSSSKGKWPEEQQQYLKHYAYFPVSAAAELQQLAKETKKILPQITTDILIIQPKDDQTVQPKSAEIIAKNVSSKRKKCLWLEGGTHNVPVVPPYNTQIVTEIHKFVQESKQTIAG